MKTTNQSASKRKTAFSFAGNSSLQAVDDTTITTSSYPTTTTASLAATCTCRAGLK